MNNFWSQRTPGEKRMLVLGLLIVAIGLPMALFPGGGGTKKLLSSTEARQKYTDAVKKRDTMIADNTKLQPAIDSMIYKEPSELLVPKVIRTLQGFAKDSGIHIREIKPLRSKRYPTVTKEMMSVRFTSEFGKTVPFLYRIDDPKGKLVVEKFNVSAADPKSRTVDVDVQVALYTQAPASPAEGGS